MKFTLETPKNKQEQEWSPLPHELALKEIDMVKGVFTTLNQKWAKRGIKLTIALCMLTSFNTKLDSAPRSSPQSVVVEASIGGGLENFNTHTLIPDDIEKSIDQALDSDKAPENLPVEEGENAPSGSDNESSEENKAIISSESVPVDTTPLNENVSQTIATPEPSAPVDLVVEAEPVVNKEAISKMNSKAQAFASSLGKLAQIGLVDDIRDHYDSVLKYARGESSDVMEKGGKNFKELVKIFGNELNNFDPVTRKAAAKDIADMADIVKNNGLLDIPDKLAQWAKK